MINSLPNKRVSAMQNLDPRILQALLNATPTRNSNGQYQEYIDPTTGQSYSLSRGMEQLGGDASYYTGNLLPGEIVASTGQKNNLGYNLQHVYDQQGSFVREDDDGAGFGAFGDFVGDNMGAILAAIATMGVASAAGAGVGAAEGAAAGGLEGSAIGGAAGGTGSITLPTMAELGVGGATLTPELLATMPVLEAAGGTAALGSSLGSTGANAMRAGELANYATNGALPSSAAQVGGNMGWMDWLNTAVNGTTGTRGLLDYATGNRGWLDAASTAANAANGNRRGTNWLGGLLGAAAGAASSRDGVQTQSTEPWGPAQPMLKSLMGDLDALRIQYRDEPVSPMLRGAYGNQASLIDAANVGSAGMLAGMQANASGQNSYSRQNKGRSLVGSNPVWNWQPGLLSPLVGG
jgi:hypothetical protein